MKHYKRPDNSVFAFEDDGSQDYLITADMQAVEGAALEALRQRPLDAKADAQTTIEVLERREQAPRFVREALLEVAAYMAEVKGADLGLTKVQALALLASKNSGYIKLKALDDQIAQLRAIVKGDA